MIVEHVACDQNELYVVLDRLRPELLDRFKACFDNTVTGVHVKPGDAHTEMKISRVKKTDHESSSDIRTFLGQPQPSDILRHRSSLFLMASCSLALEPCR